MILLTGGTGFVGRHLVQRFVLEAWPTRLLRRTPGTLPHADNTSWALGDLRNETSLRAALEGVDTVVHAAAVVPAGVGDEGEIDSVNVGGTAAIARAARVAGVSRFIHISSAGVYGDGVNPTPHRESDQPSPGSPYERSKYASERALVMALAGSDVSWTILRPQGLYGADRPATAALFREVATRKLWIHGSARMVVHPTYIDDLVAAVALTLTRADVHGEVFNIGGSRSLELHELITLIGSRVTHAPRQVILPRSARRTAAVVEQVWRAFGTPPAALTRQAREWINRSVNIDKARQMLGFEPIPIESALDRTALQLTRPAMNPQHA